MHGGNGEGVVTVNGWLTIQCFGDSHMNIVMSDGLRERDVGDRLMLIFLNNGSRKAVCWDVLGPVICKQ